MKKNAALFTFLFLSISGYSQQNSNVEMANDLYLSGKIYVVVTVLSIIFIGIVIYLIALDRKICKLEKEINKK